MIPKSIYSVVVSACLLAFVSCEKEYNVSTGLANIDIVNAIVNVPTVVINTGGREGYWSTLAASNTSRVNYGSSLGNTFVADSSSLINIVATPPDTLTSLYRPEHFVAQPGELYTLFLAGTKGAVESLLLKEQLVSRGDSATGIRFVNLVSNSTPVSVNIRNAATPEVSSLSYLQVSDFKAYDATKANSSYVFEVRDVATSTVLVTYTYTVARSFNVTLALRGLVGGTGTNALNITRVNHY